MIEKIENICDNRVFQNDSWEKNSLVHVIEQVFLYQTGNVIVLDYIIFLYIYQNLLKKLW